MQTTGTPRSAGPWYSIGAMRPVSNTTRSQDGASFSADKIAPGDDTTALSNTTVPFRSRTQTCVFSNDTSKAALRFFRKAMRRYGRPETIVSQTAWRINSGGKRWRLKEMVSISTCYTAEAIEVRVLNVTMPLTTSRKEIRLGQGHEPPRGSRFAPVAPSSLQPKSSDGLVLSRRRASGRGSLYSA